MRAAALAALLLVVAGCGGGPRPLEMVSAEPPAGAEDLGVTGQQRSPGDSKSRIPRFRVEAEDGSALSYTVVVRNTSQEAVEVTGVVADSDRDGALVPQRVAGAPVRIGAGAEEELTIEGMVDGCRYGGQLVSIAGPELELSTGAQALPFPIEVELVTTGCPG